MNSVLVELHYFPSVAYLKLLAQSEEIFMEKKENYTKRSYRNRCHILSPNGVQRLSIPLVKGKNAQMPITDVLISYDSDWQSQHWKSIMTAYGNAPYFEYYAPELLALFAQKTPYLFEWNLACLNFLFESIYFNPILKMTNSYEKSPSGLLDYRNKITPQSDSYPTLKTLPYGQVFEDKFGFVAGLSSLDLLFCLGPESMSVLV